MDTAKQIDFKSEKPDKAWFFFTLLFLVIDYGRPQDILPIGAMRPAMIIILVLSFFILTRGNFPRYDSKQTRFIFYFIILLCLYVPLARNNMFALGTVKVMLILYMPFILSVMACVTSLERLKKTVLILISVMVYVAIYGLTHHGTGSGNYFKDENDLSLYVNMYLPFCYFLMLYEQKRMMKAFYAFALATGLFAVVISFSRGGFIGLVAIGFVIWIISPRKVISLILISLIGLSVYHFAGDSYLKEVHTIADSNDGTAKARIESWKAGWRMFLDNPLGVGGGNFSARFPEYQSDYFKRGMWGRAAHSVWFTLIPELGIVGIFIYLSLLYYNLKDIFLLKRINPNKDPNLRYLQYLSLAFIASFAGYFASGTFLSVLYYPHYWYLTAILVATTKIAKNLKSQESVEAKLL